MMTAGPFVPPAGGGSVLSPALVLLPSPPRHPWGPGEVGSPGGKAQLLVTPDWWGAQLPFGVARFNM